jgi:hypothetical protein
MPVSCRCSIAYIALKGSNGKEEEMCDSDLKLTEECFTMEVLKVIEECCNMQVLKVT